MQAVQRLRRRSRNQDTVAAPIAPLLTPEPGSVAAAAAAAAAHGDNTTSGSLSRQASRARRRSAPMKSNSSNAVGEGLASSDVNESKVSVDRAVIWVALGAVPLSRWYRQGTMVTVDSMQLATFNR